MSPHPPNIDVGKHPTFKETEGAALDSFGATPDGAQNSTRSGHGDGEVIKTGEAGNAITSSPQYRAIAKRKASSTTGIATKKHFQAPPSSGPQVAKVQDPSTSATETLPGKAPPPTLNSQHNTTKSTPKASETPQKRLPYTAAEEVWLLSYVSTTYLTKAGRDWIQITAAYNEAHPDRPRNFQSLSAKHSHLSGREQ
jgi:hypothetical protein